MSIAPDAMVEDSSIIQPHLGSHHAEDGEQPEPATVSINGTATPEHHSDHQMAFEAANGETRQEDEVTINIDGQDPGHDSRIKVDFEFLWRLRKYLLLLAVLAVSVTYNAGLSPPGGFWTDSGADHHAGDPLLPVKFFQRYQVFFYCNATAFAASLVLTILLLSRGVVSQHVWLRSMQVTMILDLFSLMGAYAAGSCRALRSSVYILVLVCAVFLYVGVHILVSTRVVPSWMKQQVRRTLDRILEKLQGMLCHMFSVCHVSSVDWQRSIRIEKKEIEEARKFILMLATFAATVTYQAGLSPPGGFWAVNDHGYRPATFVLRRHNLLRFDVFICCNDTSFVASLVTVMLLLSTELSMHGIRTQALFVCIIADLLGLMGAYASGCCRDVATSLSVVFIIVAVLICTLILVIFLQSETVTAWIDRAVKPRFDNLLTRLSWPREQDSQRSVHQDADEQDALSSVQCHSGDNHLLPTRDVESASTTDLHSTESSMSDKPNQSLDQNEQEVTRNVCSSSADALTTTKEFPMSNTEEQSAGSQLVAIPMGPSSSCDSVKSIQDALPLPGSMDKNAASGDQRIANIHVDNAEHTGEKVKSFENDSTNNDQATQDQERISAYSESPDDAHLKKSRTYLLLLAILAVSLTYQAGLTPPGGFWTSNATTHSAGDPILEDNHHERYLAFFYFNATTFAASLVMIIMLLSRKMSNKVIKRRALQTAMITDLLALTGAFIVGSCREETKSIYISVVMFPVVAYVLLHVLVSRHVVPEGWKQWLTLKLKHHLQPESPRTDKDLMDVKEKDLERRRNLLFILAILAATVTYQAGLNPPGGIWPDQKSEFGTGTPGDPVLQDSHPKRYDVFYYSNAVSFVSSVAVIILLVNRESCEHGIKSYALRVCLVAGLLGLLIAYSAGSCREVKPTVYLIVIAAAVLICLVVQVLVLTSAQDALQGPLAWLSRWLHKIFQLEADSETPPQGSNAQGITNGDETHAQGITEKKERKRHKYLMLLAILAASIAYQAGLNPPGGFWPDDDDTGHGYKAGNPVLKDIHLRRYMVFFVSNSIAFMASITVVMLLLSKSVRKKKVPLQALHLIMVLDLLALMTAYAAGSCRKIRTSVFVLVVVCVVVVYLVLVIILLSGIAKLLKGRKGRWLLCR